MESEVLTPVIYVTNSNFKTFSEYTNILHHKIYIHSQSWSKLESPSSPVISHVIASSQTTVQSAAEAVGGASCQTKSSVRQVTSHWGNPNNPSTTVGGDIAINIPPIFDAKNVSF